MSYLPYLDSVQTENTMEKLDEVTNTIGQKIKNFAKFFFIVCGWFAFNFIVVFFFNRMRSLSLETYRMFADGLREVAAQDLSIIIVFLLESKFNCAISLAMFFACGLAFFICLLNDGISKSIKNHFADHSMYSQSGLNKTAYVISYKQHVAFLA